MCVRANLPPLQATARLSEFEAVGSELHALASQYAEIQSQLADKEAYLAQLAAATGATTVL